MKLRGNVSLILGLAIPVVMVVLVAISIYVPRMFVHPEYNFIYAVGDRYTYGNLEMYTVGQNGSLVKNEIPPRPNTSVQQSPPKLYTYDTSTNTEHEISFEEAQMLHIITGDTSPDGFAIKNGSRGGGAFFLFGLSGTDYYSMYLSKGSVAIKLNVSEKYSYNFRLLGWLQK